MRFGHSVALAEAVRDYRLDLGYVIGWQVPAGLHYEPLHQSRFTLLVAREHPLAREETVTVGQVADAGLIAAPLDDVEWVHYEKVLRELDLGPTDVTLEIDGIQARVLAAAACRAGCWRSFAASDRLRLVWLSDNLVGRTGGRHAGNGADDRVPADGGVTGR